MQGGIYGASTLASVVGASVNYNMIKTQNASLGVRANQVELQAEQEINSAREQFTNSMSQLQYNAVQRGIKSSSGSVQQNLELSSRNFGEDVRITKQNAEMQAQSLRGQQKVNNKVAKAQLWGKVGNSFLSLGSALGGMAIERDKVDKVRGSKNR